MATQTPQNIVEIKDADLVLGGRKLWQELNLSVKPGEFLAILGPNGSGKTSLLRVLLGMIQLSRGSVKVYSEPPRQGSSLIGYVPQQKSFDQDLPIRGRDLVRLGLDGHKYGIGRTASAERKVNEIIREVDAEQFADAPIGLLSGGEQQRLRIAQALLSDPKVLLCDEPLLSLDLSNQQIISDLINTRRQKANTAVLFVTHEINPVLPLVDRVLYLVGGRWAVGTPDAVLTTENLSRLYGTSVEVIHSHGRVIIVGTGDSMEDVPHHHGGSK